MKIRPDAQLSLMTIACLLACQTAAAQNSAAAAAGTPSATVAKIDIPAISVTGSRTTRPFEIPAAVSHHKADEFGQDVNNLIRTLPGTFTQHDIGQGGFAVNIRGLEGLGRVNTSVDGVDQTFFQNNPIHGWNGTTVYVDDNFIAGIDVERGSVGGASGANALSGHVEIRTLDVDDLIAKNNYFGLQVTHRQGSNGYGRNGMTAVAARHQFNGDSSIGFLSAISGKRKFGYQNGAGETIASDVYDANVPMESGVSSESSLNKLQLNLPGKQSLSLSHMAQRSEFANNHTPLQISSQTATARYRYKPLSDWLDFDARLSYSHTQQKFLDGTNADEDYVGRTTSNPSWSFTVENRSLTDIKGSDLELNYGAKIVRTSYSTDHENKMMMVEGSQNTDVVFAGAQWKPGNWLFSTGLNFERYGMEGYLPPTDDDGVIVSPKGGDIRFKQLEQHWNPYAGIAYRPLEWLQLYAKIGKSSRSPNVHEFMYANNALQNIYSINPNLKGESALNRDIGLNVLKNNTLLPEDSLRLKVNYFNNKVENYIVQDQFYICGDDSLRRCTLDEYLQSESNRISPGGIFINSPKTTHMHGWEVEGGYHTKYAYMNFSWSQTKTDFPADYLADMGFSHVRTQPENIWMLDLGTRLFDNRLNLGARLKYTGKDTIAGGVDTDTNVQVTWQAPANPKLIDLYASYQPARNLKLFLNVENVANSIYNYPLSGGTLGTGNLEDSKSNQGTGRGRTIYGGMTLKF